MMIADFSVNVGYRCNNNCIHCFLGTIRDLYPERSSKEIKELIDEGESLNAESLTIIGGDPTIRKDFFEILKYATNKNFNRIYLETNGRTFSVDNFARKVFEICPNLEIGMSFHHINESVHDRITQVIGSWKQSVKGIKNMKKYGAKHIRTNCVVSKLNYEALPQLTEFLAKLGIDELSFYLMRIEGNALKNLDKLFVSIEEIQPYLFKALEIVEKKGIDVKTFGFPYCKMKGYERFVEEKDALRGYVDGGVMIFNQPEGKSDWQKSRVKEMRIKLKTCRECKYFYICEGIWREYLTFKKCYTKLIPIIGKKMKSINELKM